MMRRPVAAGMCLAVMLILLPRSVCAQATNLSEIADLAGFGRADEARAALLIWWEDERGDASRNSLQRALWLRGRLTVDPAQAARDFRRLLVEYPGGSFTDRALLRLAQAAYVQGDDEIGQRHMASLRRDYPGSSALEEAEAWLTGGGSAPPLARRRIQANPASRPAAVDETRATAAIEEAAPVTQTERPATQSPPSGTGRYAVQLGAFSEEGRAGALFERARGADLGVRLVRVTGSRLIHVRVGRFHTSAEAIVFFRSVTSLGFTAAVVRDAQNEELVRG